MALPFSLHLSETFSERLGQQDVTVACTTALDWQRGSKRSKNTVEETARAGSRTMLSDVAQRSAVDRLILGDAGAHVLRSKTWCGQTSIPTW